MSAQTFVVIAAHTSEFPRPITFGAGAPLEVGERYQGSEGWDDWLLCSTPGQESGWVPAQIIEMLDEHHGRAIEDYTARELDVAPGERLVTARSLNGWFWCTREGETASGWVPQANLQPVVVVQEEVSGCGIASAANLLGKSYTQMKQTANAMGIHAEDEALWSDTGHVRCLLASAGMQVAEGETPFESWAALPDLALLAIKHHQQNSRYFWHWVVFQRIGERSWVLDSASYLPSNLRTDFADMQPKWFIEVTRSNA